MDKTFVVPQLLGYRYSCRYEIIRYVLTLNRTLGRGARGYNQILYAVILSDQPSCGSSSLVDLLVCSPFLRCFV